MDVSIKTHTTKSVWSIVYMYIYRGATRYNFPENIVFFSEDFVLAKMEDPDEMLRSFGSSLVVPQRVLKMDNTYTLLLQI